MFKELGEFIDACGLFTADTIRTSANIIKRSIESSDDEPPMQGCIAPDSDKIAKIMGERKTIITRGLFDYKSGKIVACEKEDEDN